MNLTEIYSDDITHKVELLFNKYNFVVFKFDNGPCQNRYGISIVPKDLLNPKDGDIVSFSKKTWFKKVINVNDKHFESMISVFQIMYDDLTVTFENQSEAKKFIKILVLNYKIPEGRPPWTSEI